MKVKKITLPVRKLLGVRQLLGLLIYLDRFPSPNFLQTWRKYDTDHSGFIETEELKVSGAKLRLSALFPDAIMNR